MDYRILNQKVSVAPQMSVSDVEEARKAGFKSIICNRPDAEEPAHALSTQIGKAANQAGLAFAYIPAISGNLTAENAADMAKAYGALPNPIIAYCRSGTRSQKLWEMSGVLAS